MADDRKWELMKPIAEQIILITGATDGLDKGVALELAKQGATVLLHGRSQGKLDATKQELEQATGSTKLQTYRADLASLQEVRTLAEKILSEQPRLDTLINNAAVGAGDREKAHQRELSADGYELRFAVNYLAPFLLTQLLLPVLRKAESARIINVSSVGQQPIDFDDVMLDQHYEGLEAYRQSKLAQIMFTFDLAEQLKDTGITVNALHPASLMPTKMVFEYFDRTMSTVQDGIDSVLHLATAPELDDITGKYFDQQREARANAQAYDAQARRQLWELSERLTGL
jgi:NAD(P)-dependent dehydrogenase (short-subunit alcohol dehydrogenase family)